MHMSHVYARKELQRTWETTALTRDPQSGLSSCEDEKGGGTVISSKEESCCYIFFKTRHCVVTTTNALN